jgi:glycosyltransferase involved in cell wall biosynthesis
MRIIHVVNALHSGNGIVNVAVDLAVTQSRNGHEVWMVSGGGSYEDLLAGAGVRCRQINQTRRVRSVARAAFHIRRLVREIDPDIVNAHMMTGAVLFRLVRWRNRFALVCTVHNSWQRSSAVMTVGDRIIAVSATVKDDLIRRRIPALRIDVVRNGTVGSPRHPDAASVVPASLHHPAVVTVAGLYERKGIADLIDAFALVAEGHPEAHLYIVGDGPDRMRFEERARRTGFASRISFEGYQPLPSAYLLGADIFVLASHADPFPLVVLEARSVGCPIVASAVDGIPEALDGGAAGLLFPSGDIEVLAGHLASLLDDSGARADLGVRSKAGIEWLSVERVASETEQVYQRARRTRIR